MAIRRCPYCKAIIDESQKYCNNCGTQLLFPEDELVEEDIKGEKIVDEEFKDAEEEFEESLEPSGEQDEPAEEIDLEEVLEGEAAFPGEAEKVEAEDEIAEGEEPAEEPRKKSEPAPKKPERMKPEPVKTEPPKPEPKRPEPAKPAPPKLEKPEPVKTEEPVGEKPIKKAPPPKAVKTPAIKEQAVQAIAADEPPDDVEDELGAGENEEPEDEDDGKSDPDTREEIVRLIAALEKKHKKLSLSREEEKILAPLEEASNLPPWVDLSKSNASTEIVETETEEKLEAHSFVPGDTMDFEEEVMSRAEKMAPTRPTIGIPEKVTKSKSSFLFEKKEVDTKEAEALEIPHREEEAADESFDEEIYEIGEEAAEAGVPAVEAPRTRLGFFGRLTAFVFDLIFIALVWMGTVWGASLLMDVPVRTLVRTVPIPLGAFFAILLAGYFFLFFFFLGETLGGRMASPRD